MLWSYIANRRGHTKTNQKVRESLYHCILHNYQVLLSPMVNYFLYVYIDGNSEKKLVPDMLLQVYVQEIYNIVVSPPEEGGLK